MSTLVTKADGTQEPFKMEKLRRSLHRAGATKDEIVDICKKIEADLHDGITTQAIYRKAFEYLRASEAPVAARYSLRRALFGLGPTGFPFEDYLARLFAAEGYTTKVRLTMRGKCATHEIDVAAYNDTDSFVAEAKFHARPGIKSDLQVALYSFARLHDLREQNICTADHCGIKRFMIVTNTKFTSAARDYAECSGVELLSWDYPRENSLHDRIQKAHIYPITVLQSLSQAQQRTLIERGVIVCSDLVENPQLLRHIHVSQKKHERIINEAKHLCTHDGAVVH